jgi:NAD(P)-dependent dehydrogenase (short-subunit alcohol dehydrogenase family)
MSMKTIVVTGSQSGLGLATRDHLQARGDRVIGVDLPGKGAEVGGDLASPEGRAAVVDLVLSQCGGRLDGIVANAGVDSANVDLVVGLNYRGVVELLEPLADALAAAGGRVVVTVSNSILIHPGIPEEPVAALLRGDFEGAAAALHLAPQAAYAVTKTAIARWIRREAPAPEWAGRGIGLNGICPGPVMTPLLEHDLADPVKGAAIRALPRPLGGFPEPRDVAAVTAFLLGPDSRFLVGQLLVVDGGMEAALRGPDWPTAWGIDPAAFAARLGLA